MKIFVQKNKCNGCGICAKVCPVEAIQIIEGIAVIDVETCVMCGVCEKECPTNAIVIQKSKELLTDINDYRGVWVVCEQRSGKLSEISFELLSEGKKLAEKRDTQLCAIIIGHLVEPLSKEAIAYGADFVYVIDDKRFSHFVDDTCSFALVHLIKKYKPEIVIGGATAIGRSLLPRVAAELLTGLTADCTGLDIDEDGNLVQTRPAFGGNIMATILCTRTRPQMATVRPKVMKMSAPDRIRHGNVVVEKLDVKIPDPLITIVETIADIFKGPQITESDVLVAGGGGLQKTENFRLIKELADVLGGAVAASRTAVDRGWVPYPYQVGQTGRTVCPKLYIAVGISGAIQHLVGMQTSEKIIAINRDAGAPIFKVADVGLVGDLFEIIPKLISALKLR